VLDRNHRPRLDGAVNESRSERSIHIASRISGKVAKISARRPPAGLESHTTHTINTPPLAQPARYRAVGLMTGL